jgi:tRNA A37 threonylcarbamoyladenosine synthetase subunit TsaC/SUA5/YrdC
MFLTSANISGKDEIYSINELKETFEEYLKR